MLMYVTHFFWFLKLVIIRTQAKYDKAKMGASEAIELVAALTVRLEETTASLETIRDEKLQLEKRLETTEQVGASKKREEELLLSEIGKTKVQFSAALEQKQQDQERLELAARETTEIQTKLSVLTDEMVSLKQHSVRNQEELRIALKETDQQKEKLRQVQSLLETLQQARLFFPSVLFFLIFFCSEKCAATSLARRKRSGECKLPKDYQRHGKSSSTKESPGLTFT